MRQQHNNMDLKILSWNSQSVRNEKKDLVVEFCHKNCIDVLCLQETWLKPYINMSFQGYNILRKDRIETGRGGVLIGISKKYHYTEVHIELGDNYEEYVEIVGCKLHLGNGKILNVINVYNSNGNNKDIGGIINELLDKIPNAEQVVLIGDFNAHSKVWCNCDLINASGKSLEDMLLENNICLITPKGLPTRKNPITGVSTTIDLTFTSPDLVASATVSTLVNTSLFSDHAPILLNVCDGRFEISDKFETNKITKFQIKKADWRKFKELLEQKDILAVVEREQHVDDKVKVFQDSIIEAATKSVPLKAKYKGQRNSCIWWNKDCDAAKKKYLRRKNEYEQATTIYNYIEVKRAYAAFKRAISQAKKKSWEEFIENLDFRKPVSKVYVFIKQMQSKPPPRKSNPPVVYNNQLLLTDQDKANASANYLNKTIGNTDPNATEVARMTAKVKRMANQDLQSPYNQPFTNVEIDSVIRNLPITSPGEDMIYPQFVQALPKQWIMVLLSIINLAWNDGYFPSAWKRGQAIMIPKPGKDNSKLEDQRFITLLPVLGKVYERLVKKRLNYEVEKRGGLKDIQCGFRKNKSTIENLLCFKQDALYALQNGLVMIAVFLDVKGAFDNIVHRQILSGIIEAGIRGRMLLLSKNYLEDRVVTVRVGNTMSTALVRGRRGVPQGSALGPDFYNMGEYNIPIGEGDSNAGIFADDNTLWVMARTLEEGIKAISEVLVQVENWATDIDLKFSTHKTKAMLITRKKMKVTPIIRFYGQQIEFVSETKFLGVNIEKNLNWKPHIEMTKAACVKRLNLMKMLTTVSWGQKPSFMMEFYIKYIRSKIEYASVIYSSGSDTTLAKLNSVQNAAIRIAFAARKTTPIVFLMSESGLESLETRRKVNVLKYIKKLWTADNTNPVRSRIVKPGKIVTSNKFKKRNQENIFEMSCRISEQFGVTLKMTDMLKVPEIALPAPWETIKLHCNLKFETNGYHDSRINFKLMMAEKYRGFLDIYTDGSKKSNPISAVGAAFVIPLIQVSKSFKLHSEATIFQAEVIAIKEAIVFAKENLSNQRNIVLLSDSKSALEALANFDHNGKISREVVLCYTEIVSLMSTANICLQWIPAHVQILGNESADTAAKMACETINVFTSGSTPRSAMQLDQLIQSVRTYDFEDSRNQSGNWFVTRKVARKFERHVYQGLSRKEGRLAFRLRSGHADTKLYRAKFYGESSNCEFCDKEESLVHLLIDCDKYTLQRQHIKAFFHERRKQLSVNLILGGFANDSDNIQILKLVVQFITAIGRDRTM